MLKKIIIVIIFITLTLLTIQQFQNLEKNDKIISQLQSNIKAKEQTSEEYLELYNEIKKEVDDIENISKNINLLKRRIKENEELHTLLQEDLENLKEKNIKLEKELNNLKRKEQNTYILTNKITYNQFPNYPTGCESVALYILLKYNNIDVQVEEIIDLLKKGELPYKIGDIKYGGNPEIEFIGNPKSRYSYGVYNKPLADVANKFKSNITSKIGLDFEEMLEIVKTGKPVLVWTTINLSKPYISQSWTYRPTGETINWISGEHAVVVIGFNQNQIIISDPYTGTIRYFDKTLFESRYNFLGRRALYY